MEEFPAEYSCCHQDCYPKRLSLSTYESLPTAGKVFLIIFSVVTVGLVWVIFKCVDIYLEKRKKEEWKKFETIEAAAAGVLEGYTTYGNYSSADQGIALLHVLYPELEGNPAAWAREETVEEIKTQIETNIARIAEILPDDYFTNTDNLNAEEASEEDTLKLWMLADRVKDRYLDYIGYQERVFKKFQPNTRCNTDNPDFICENTQKLLLLLYPEILSDEKEFSVTVEDLVERLRSYLQTNNDNQALRRFFGMIINFDEDIKHIDRVLRLIAWAIVDQANGYSVWRKNIAEQRAQKLFKKTTSHEGEPEKITVTTYAIETAIKMEINLDGDISVDGINPGGAILYWGAKKSAASFTVEQIVSSQQPMRTQLRAIETEIFYQNHREEIKNAIQAYARRMADEFAYGQVSQNVLEHTFMNWVIENNLLPSEQTKPEGEKEGTFGTDYLTKIFSLIPNDKKEIREKGRQYPLFCNAYKKRMDEIIKTHAKSIKEYKHRIDEKAKSLAHQFFFGDNPAENSSFSPRFLSFIDFYNRPEYGIDNGPAPSKRLIDNYIQKFIACFAQSSFSEIDDNSYLMKQFLARCDELWSSNSGRINEYCGQEKTEAERCFKKWLVAYEPTSIFGNNAVFIFNGVLELSAEDLEKKIRAIIKSDPKNPPFLRKYLPEELFDQSEYFITVFIALVIRQVYPTINIEVLGPPQPERERPLRSQLNGEVNRAKREAREYFIDKATNQPTIFIQKALPVRYMLSYEKFADFVKADIKLTNLEDDNYFLQELKLFVPSDKLPEIDGMTPIYQLAYYQEVFSIVKQHKEIFGESLFALQFHMRDRIKLKSLRHALEDDSLYEKLRLACYNNITSVNDDAAGKRGNIKYLDIFSEALYIISEREQIFKEQQRNNSPYAERISNRLYREFPPLEKQDKETHKQLMMAMLTLGCKRSRNL